MGAFTIPLIQAGASILGGLFGKSKVKQISAGDNAYSHVDGIMRAAKDFNINPQFLFGSVGQMGGTPGSVDNSAFGSAIADAGMLMADALGKRAGAAGLLNKLTQENTALKRQNTSLTLRPTVPGIFARASSNARSAGSLGGGGAAYGGVGGSVTNAPPVSIFGTQIVERAGTSDAQEVENKYGDVVQSLHGMAKYFSDVGNTYRSRLDRLGVTTPGKNYLAAMIQPGGLGTRRHTFEGWKPYSGASSRVGRDTLKIRSTDYRRRKYPHLTGRETLADLYPGMGF